MIVYLNRGQLAELAGLPADGLSRYKLPEPDAVIGPINDDGTIPRGTWRGWLPETAEEWNAERRRLK